MGEAAERGCVTGRICAADAVVAAEFGGETGLDEAFRADCLEIARWLVPRGSSRIW